MKCDGCYAIKHALLCIFLQLKLLPGLDLRRFVYPQTFSMNGAPIGLIKNINELYDKTYLHSVFHNYKILQALLRIVRKISTKVMKNICFI